MVIGKHNNFCPSRWSKPALVCILSEMAQEGAFIAILGQLVAFMLKICGGDHRVVGFIFSFSDDAGDFFFMESFSSMEKVLSLGGLFGRSLLCKILHTEYFLEISFSSSISGFSYPSSSNYCNYPNGKSRSSAWFGY